MTTQLIDRRQPSRAAAAGLDIRAHPVLRELSVVRSAYSRAEVKVLLASPGTIEHREAGGEVVELREALRQTERSLEERPWTDI